MTNREIVKYCIDEIIKAGADKVSCSLSVGSKNELNVDAGELSLFRTTFNRNLSLKAIKENKKGNISLNKLDKESIDQAIVELMDITNSTKPDTANDISEFQPAKTFNLGSKEPNLDLMYSRLKEFVEFTNNKYPKVILEQAILDFSYAQTILMNSNGIDFTINKGVYGFGPMFTSKDGKNTSSFNYAGFSSIELAKSLHEYANIELLMKQSEEQITTQQIPEKFVGDVIITPECFGDFVSAFESMISDYPLISGTSIYKDKLNEQIADKKLSIHCRPVSNDIEVGYFVTSDGYETKNSTVIDKGELKTFLLGLYGSNKTGLEKAVNSGGAFVIDAGDKSLDDLIKSVKQGILMARFSGGNPSENGDFSGVAKNSYYIENGKVKFPISETMVSGNIAKMFMNIKNISSERTNDGTSIIPWIQFSGLTVSGK
ncbi:MAG: TldD/PmbA family protein [Candidatus Marinimicrobia bacterium]|nr:TldD/PmbA family protein [Candidatus Neomarinimicrobiota bacterium]MBL7022571.1 TldD/PmbA family protein [Candidatus Neomarinimicrobiota bacterium]MBL7108927.1 TldD/PmbA family protein [Candidatus Neomarinimicrobiota bacterium]